MRTKLAALLLAVLLLTGCVPYVRWQITTNIPQTQQMPAPTPAPTAMPQPDSGLSRRQMAYGSAGLLTEPTVLVSVYLNDAAGGRVWTEDAKAETRQYLATAVQWLNEQAETYGRTLQLYYDDGTVNSPLCRTYTPKSAIRGGRSSEESDALLTELDAVSATLDTAALQTTLKDLGVTAIVDGSSSASGQDTLYRAGAALGLDGVARFDLVFTQGGGVAVRGADTVTADTLQASRSTWESLTITADDTQTGGDAADPDKDTEAVGGKDTSTPAETVDEAQQQGAEAYAYAAAKLAACDEFIHRLPDEYQTVIGENGKTLSGGERQRLSIARAFLKNAPVILLDESTASIDPENETKIQQAIGRLIQNKTVLIIAHKLRTVAGCDKIVVLDSGSVAEEGTHETLMEQKGLYYKLYTLQSESLVWKVRAQIRRYLHEHKR